MRRLRKRDPNSLSPEEQEELLAGDLGGRRQPGSGSKAYAKGDAKSGDLYGGFLGECKQTKYASRSIRGDELAKIAHEALAEGKKPLFEIVLKGCDDHMGRQPWVLIPKWVLLELLEDGV